MSNNCGDVRSCRTCSDRPLNECPWDDDDLQMRRCSAMIRAMARYGSTCAEGLYMAHTHQYWVRVEAAITAAEIAAECMNEG